jgi:L-iditol 2-dehydrogenase
MQVARFYAPRDLRVEDAPEPEPGPRGVLVRVRACSTCGTDAKIFEHGHPRLVPPRVLGHEVTGEVVAPGERVAGWKPGDRVQIIAAIPCGRCATCRRGWQTVCPAQKAIGYQFDGGFAEYLHVPEDVLAVDGLHRIPDGVGYAEASLAEPLACVINGQDLARVGEGDSVVVVGAGPIGCLHVRLARARGAASVCLVGLNRPRLELAAERVAPDAVVCSEESDAVGEVLRATGGHGADVVIVACGSGRAQSDALRMAALRGRISFFGGLPKSDPIIPFDSNLLHYRELTVVGASGSTPGQNGAALRGIACGAIPVADLITHRLPLSDVVEGIQTAKRGVGMKVTIEP